MKTVKSKRGVGLGRLKRPLEIVLSVVCIVLIVFAGYVEGKRIQEYQHYCTEKSGRLQEEIQQDARFRNVTPRYSGSQTHIILTLSGSVASQRDLNALQQKAKDEFWHFKTDVRWRIKLVPQSKGQSNSESPAVPASALERQNPSFGTHPSFE